MQSSSPGFACLLPPASQTGLSSLIQVYVLPWQVKLRWNGNAPGLTLSSLHGHLQVEM